jgi:hypothetical protein
VKEELVIKSCALSIKRDSEKPVEDNNDKSESAQSNSAKPVV